MSSLSRSKPTIALGHRAGHCTLRSHGCSPAPYRTLTPLVAALVLMAVLDLSYSSAWARRPQHHPSPITSATARVTSAARPPIVVLLLVPDLGFRQLSLGPVPYLDALARQGAVGMMNIRTVRWGSVDEGFLTVGAGARANASFQGEIGQAVERSESFDGAAGAQVYRRRTGFDPGTSRILAMDMAQLMADSSAMDYDLAPGLLGDTLRAAGITPAAVGNADEPVPGGAAVLHREVVGAAMDRLGRVMYGDISPGLLNRDPDSPFSVSLNEDRVIRAVQAVSGSARFIAVEDGDLLAVAQTATLDTGPAFHDLEIRALGRVDSLAGALARTLDFRRDWLIVCSPVAEELAGQPASLAPIICAGPGVSGAWVSCRSTRRSALITLTDISPTVLDCLGVPAPVGMPGSPLVPVPNTRGGGRGGLWPLDPTRPLQSVCALYAAITERDRQRDDVERWFVYLCEALLLISAVAVGFPRWELLARAQVAGWGFLVPLAIPLAMLIDPFLHPASSLIAAVEIGVLSAMLVAGARIIGKGGVRSVTILAWANCLAVAADLLLGQQGMMTSMLSYSPSEGARYYGIGNEYMGVLVGSSVTALCLAARGVRYRRIAAIAGLFVPVLLICLPQIGAKAGGALVAVPTAALSGWLLLGRRPTWRTLVCLIALSLAALGAMSAWDLHHAQEMSHVGRATQGILTGGTREITNIAARKSGMEWKLVKYSPWSRVLMFAILAMVIMGIARRVAFTGIMAGRRIGAATWGLGAAAVTGLLFNDAGVLAAALAFVYCPAMIAARLNEEAP